MKRVRWFILVIAVMLPGIVLAQDTGGIVVTGSVTNGTPGGGLPVGDPVTLRFYSQGEWTAIYTTTLSADGTFRFADFAMDAGSDFVTHIVYQEVDYYSSPTKLAGGTDVVTDIAIFEPTTDPSGVVIDQMHYFIAPSGDSVRIAEYYLIGNTGDRTYIGTENADGTRTTITFTPPAGARELFFDGPGLNERFVGDMAHFADTRPIPPGATVIDVDFSYQLPFTDGMRIERVVDLPITSVALIVSSESLGLSGSGLNPQGMMNTQMGPAASYAAGPLAAGEPLAFTFVPQTMTVTTTGSGTTARTRTANPTRDAFLGAVVLALAAFVGYRLWKPASVPPPPEAARPLLEAIAALDTRFAAGDLPEEAYHREREALKQQLAALLQD
ncbi:MAG: hypothetical protein ACP5J4_11275 [Anaerolineae bacterium]